MIRHVQHWLDDRARERTYRNALIVDPLYDDSDELKMFVVVRSDILPPINQGIQALHAVVEYGMRAKGSGFETWAEEYKTVVVLGSDQDSFNRVIAKAKRMRVPYQCFTEPDLNGMVTAVAFEPMVKAKSKDLMWGLRRAR